jgi:hypothetical protein
VFLLLVLGAIVLGLFAGVIAVACLTIVLAIATKLFGQSGLLVAALAATVPVPLYAWHRASRIEEGFALGDIDGPSGISAMLMLLFLFSASAAATVGIWISFWRLRSIAQARD